MYLGWDDDDRKAQLEALEGVLMGYSYAVALHSVPDTGADFLPALAAFIRLRYGWEVSAGAIAAVRAHSDDDRAAWSRLWLIVDDFFVSQHSVGTGGILAIGDGVRRDSDADGRGVVTAMTKHRRTRLEKAVAPLSEGAATGRLVSYSIGHSVCEIELAGPEGVVRLRAEATRRIESWNRWDVMDLRSWVDPDGNVVIVDRDAGFKLVAGAVFVLGPDGAPPAEEDDDELPG
jgi:hypothetical protein